jgi:hypothetical protein
MVVVVAYLLCCLPLLPLLLVLLPLGRAAAAEALWTAPWVCCNIHSLLCMQSVHRFSIFDKQRAVLCITCEGIGPKWCVSATTSIQEV